MGEYFCEYVTIPYPARAGKKAIQTIPESLNALFLQSGHNKPQQGSPQTMMLKTSQLPFATTALLCLLLASGCTQKPAGSASQESMDKPVELASVDEAQTVLLPEATNIPAVEAEIVPPRPIDPLLAGINPEDLAQVQASAKKHYLDRWDIVAERSRFLRQRLLKSLQEADAPESLQVIPVVESTYNPYAFSRSGAVGLWQLMPRTARGLGIQPKKELDGRRHIETSTQAAAAYLLQLHERFGSWPLALAAYNIGPNALASRLAKNPWKTEDGLDNMPVSTGARIYVQHILGLAALMQLQTFSLPEPIETRQLVLQAPVDLQQLAEAAGMDKDHIFHFNPGLNQAQYLHGSVAIDVPAILFDQLQAGAATAKPKFVQLTVKKGDSLWSIARKYHTSVETLKQLNGKAGKHLSIGQKLKVPANRLARADALANPLMTAGNRIRYKVRPGDSLWRIAKRFGTTPKAIARHNQLSVKSTIRPGDTLWVHARI